MTQQYQFDWLFAPSASGRAGWNYHSVQGLLENRPRLILDVVPEPSTGLLLLGLGLGFGLKRPRLRRAADRQDVLAR